MFLLCLGFHIFLAFLWCSFLGHFESACISRQVNLSMTALHFSVWDLLTSCEPSCSKQSVSYLHQAYQAFWILNDTLLLEIRCNQLQSETFTIAISHASLGNQWQPGSLQLSNQAWSESTDFFWRKGNPPLSKSIMTWRNRPSVCLMLRFGRVAILPKANKLDVHHGLGSDQCFQTGMEFAKRKRNHQHFFDIIESSLCRSEASVFLDHWPPQKLHTPAPHKRPRPAAEAVGAPPKRDESPPPSRLGGIDMQLFPAETGWTPRGCWRDRHAGNGVGEWTHTNAWVQVDGMKLMLETLRSLGFCGRRRMLLQSFKHIQTP